MKIEVKAYYKHINIYMKCAI